MTSFHCPYSGLHFLMSRIWPVFTLYIPDINYWCPEYGLFFWPYSGHQNLMSGIWTVKTVHIPDIVHIPDTRDVRNMARVGLGTWSRNHSTNNVFICEISKDDSAKYRRSTIFGLSSSVCSFAIETKHLFFNPFHCVVTYLTFLLQTIVTVAVKT